MGIGVAAVLARGGGRWDFIGRIASPVRAGPHLDWIDPSAGIPSAPEWEPAAVAGRSERNSGSGEGGTRLSRKGERTVGGRAGAVTSGGFKKTAPNLKILVLKSKG